MRMGNQNFSLSGTSVSRGRLPVVTAEGSFSVLPNGVDEEYGDDHDDRKDGERELEVLLDLPADMNGIETTVPEPGRAIFLMVMTVVLIYHLYILLFDYLLFDYLQLMNNLSFIIHHLSFRAKPAFIIYHSSFII